MQEVKKCLQIFTLPVILPHIMGLQTFYNKWANAILCAGGRASRGKITISGVPNLT
jgi:hypothetical protein